MRAHTQLRARQCALSIEKKKGKQANMKLVVRNATRQPVRNGNECETYEMQRTKEMCTA